MSSAADLIAMGFAPVEVAHPLPDGTCSCRDGADCRAPGKHAIGRSWMKAAVRRHAAHPTFVPAFVRLAPVTSYGLIPTKGSGLLVIDRDDPDVLLPIPPTFEVHRASAHPRRGHYFLALPDGITEADVPRSFAGGEVRIAESGYVVGPGSRHASGDVYVPNGAAVSTADRDLIDALSALRPVRRGADGEVEAVLGSRHDWMVRQARKFVGWGWSAERIEGELRERNETVCQPPLSDREFGDVLRAIDWAIKNIGLDRGLTVRRSSRHSTRGRGRGRSR